MSYPTLPSCYQIIISPLIAFPKDFFGRHSKDHSHDTNKAFTVYIGIVSHLFTNITFLAGGQISQAITGILSSSTLILGLVNGGHVVHGIVGNLKKTRSLSKEKTKAKKIKMKALSKDDAASNDNDDNNSVDEVKLRDMTMENRESWLVTGSQFLTTVGSLSYFVGDNLPSFLQNYLPDCEMDCENKGVIAGTFFLFLALTTFTFIPEVFSKLNGAINKNFNSNFIQEKRYEPEQVQWLVMRLLALSLNFDTIYSALWIHAVVTVMDCNTDVIIGSGASVLVGWITWSVYAGCYSSYLARVKDTVFKFKKAHKNLHPGYLALEIVYYTTLVLFLVTYLPVHLVADNSVPLSCSCTGDFNDTFNATDSIIMNGNVTDEGELVCMEPYEVVLTRVVLLSYETVLVTALGILALVKYNIAKTQHI